MVNIINILMQVDHVLHQQKASLIAHYIWTVGDTPANMALVYPFFKASRRPSHGHNKHQYLFINIM